MPEILRQLKSFFQNLPTSKRLSFLFLIIISIAAMILLFVKLNTINYVELFSGLSPEDAGAIINRLRTQNVPFKLENGGQTIKVSNDIVYETRISLATEGLPEGTSNGYELFDKTRLGATDFVQKLNLTRALQGELARTISSINSIETCRVHIAKPEPSLFVTDEQKVTASIVLKFVSGMSLSKQQVDGIVNLVAGSVEGLKPENVSIIDTKGNLLNQSNEEAISDVTDMQYSFKRKYEENLEKKIQSMLEKTVGTGRVAARVAAEFDFTQIETTAETFDPDSAVIRSRQSTFEGDTQGSAAINKAAGATANSPESPSSGANIAQSINKGSGKDLVNYEISKTTSKTLLPMGVLQSVSASVLIDGDYEEVKDDKGDMAKTYKPRTPEEMKVFEDIVKTAMGFSQERESGMSDQISVANVRFQPSEDEIDQVKMEKLEKKDMILYYTKIGGMALLILFLIFFVIKPIVKQILSPVDKLIDYSNLHGKKIGDIERAMLTEPGGMNAIVEAPSSPEQSLLKKEEQLNEKIEEIAMNEPGKASGVIKKWLDEK